MAQRDFCADLVQKCNKCLSQIVPPLKKLLSAAVTLADAVAGLASIAAADHSTK